jgi:hypothetical protein
VRRSQTRENALELLFRQRISSDESLVHFEAVGEVFTHSVKPQPIVARKRRRRISDVVVVVVAVC